MPTRRRRVFWTCLFLGALVLLFAGVLARCFQLQYYQADEMRARAARQQFKLVPQTARRGMIVDREGRILALSTRVYSLAADPQVLPDASAVADRLAQILNQDAGQLREKLSPGDPGRRFVWLARGVGDDQAAAVERLGIRGLILQAEYQRRYPMGALAAAVLGFTDIDGRGLEGAEACCDAYLAGRPGKLTFDSDALRRPVAWRGEVQASRPGQTVVLTLDAVIQEVVERELAAVGTRFEARWAAGLVADPTTGEILALANWPSFEPAVARQTPSELRRNRILTDPFEPGSTFKPLTLAAALAGGYVRPEETIFCHNGTYSGRGFGRITEYENHAYGDLTPGEIVIRSSNIGSAIMAQRMGKEYFYGMIEAFGFGQKTGLELRGESDGILTPLKEWKWGQYALTRAAYGQGPVVVTPLQLMRAFCCLANGGYLLPLSIVRGVVADENGELSARRIGPAAEARRVIPEDVARYVVSEVLTGVVERRSGTANKASVPGYRVFGKTGTAQVPKRNARGYEPDKYVSSFIGGAPADDPRVCVLVVVGEPNRSLGLGYTGGRVAAPSVGHILAEALPYLAVPSSSDAAAATD